ncbi:hypothetical protein GIB67_033460 [Kingdonia uniflora]|uniref:F-box protein n=1 Tax=Kingdonia uniflora TaxID=39325 RepID=A0A7J7LTV3_9MAGN|nr:hypothetical protein GIB67_033460 [Kingdonia uniflora]
MASWAELPEELIGLVVKRLVGHHDLTDYFSFRGVCRQWRSVASEKHSYAGVSGYKVPWLMMAEKENSDDRLRKVFVRKAIRLSTANDNCIVLGIYSQYGKLAIAKPADKTWMTLECPPGHHQDIICFKDQVYAVDAYGIFRICDITSIQPNAVDFASPPEEFEAADTLYLVEISGDLHLILRVDFRNRDDDGVGDPCQSENDDSHIFEIYKLDFCTKRWEELDGSIGHALFLGTNCSFSLPVSDYPELKGNCVYFTDDYSDIWEFGGGRSTGIYNFEDQKVEFINLGLDMHSMFSPPLWITPNLC